MKPIEILNTIRPLSDRVILFHSVAGKDSIALIDMATKLFDHVHCVFMYIVPGLQHMEKYIQFFSKVYKNASWHQVEHFALSSYRQTGHLGMQKNTGQKLQSLSSIMKDCRAKLQTEWIVLGSKQSDGLSRRLQLKTYDHEAIDYKNKKIYPLSKLRNKDVLAYIDSENLIQPLNYGDNRQSSSNNVTDPLFLSWCKKNYPGDYQKILEVFPDCDIILYRYENQ